MTLELIIAVGFASVPITFLICAVIHWALDRARRPKIIGYFGKRPIVDRYVKRDWPYKPEGYWPPNHWM